MATPWQKILGVIGNFIEFDSGDGPRITNNSGVLESRTAAGAALAIHRGATPVGNDDLTTKSYVDGLDTGDVSMIEIPFDFNDEGSTVSSTFAALVTGRVTMVKVEITTVFDVDPATFEVGDTADADRYVIDGDVKPTKLGLYEFPQYTDSVADVFDVAIGAAVGATTGAGRVLITYAVPAA